MKTNTLVLASRPHGEPTAAHFRFEEQELPALQPGTVLLKTRYVSVDPYMRGRMSSAKSYVAPFAVNEPLSGGVVAEVVESQSTTLPVGSLVVGNLPWQEYCVAPEKSVSLIPAGSQAPASYYLGLLGMPGLTAYFGLLDICQPKPGETVVVSGAAGAVGMVVGQLAKLQGARVIGTAGSDEKVARLLQLGFDEAFNYKTADVAASLAAAAPNGVDCYFDNVGGAITDAVYNLLNKHARIALCGQISLYNSTTEPVGPRPEAKLLKTSARLQGFIVSDYLPRWPEGVRQLTEWYNQGKLQFDETVVEGFENIPAAFLGLFAGENTGKAVVKVA
ncbi:NADP-dependent oxidoreductase [Hymenobacter lutimineralis]|uniref:NADP-dependent oxidoreductase n=1 Tax=Hymenobacter lutimineralis TaxID=2606448 RepID=A0A5D6V634_9BACT|nr:NADP-dependent oxidoreductase [Hymenobacter lutimineralis]TYZ10966.1 NADP-dependent oxidoreductase [Hymenobacter lutimineralis]